MIFSLLSLILLFFLMAIIIISSTIVDLIILSEPRPALIITDKGLRYRRYSEVTIPWSQILEIEKSYSYLTKNVTIKLKLQNKDDYPLGKEMSYARKVLAMIYFYFFDRKYIHIQQQCLFGYGHKSRAQIYAEFQRYAGEKFKVDETWGFERP